MRKPDNLVGIKFARLLVIRKAESGKHGQNRWECVCDCGKSVTVLGYNLKNGNTKSCGCLQKEIMINAKTKHNKTGSRLFNTWVHMKQRCTNSNNHAYKHYGGRGITVCDEWLNDFRSFYDWAMSNGYADNLTIDRIDVNGDYCPENCRWVTFTEQQRNKRDSVRIFHDGKIKTVGEWAEEFNCYSSVVYREILKREGRILCETN